MRKILSVYGSEVLIKTYCHNCEAYSFVREGKLICCGATYDGQDQPAEVQRESSAKEDRQHKTASMREKARILEAQDYRCLYCDSFFDTLGYRNSVPFVIRLVWDHRIPFGYIADNSKGNIVAACHVCNAIKRDKIFQSLEEARLYIGMKRRHKGYNS